MIKIELIKRRKVRVKLKLKTLQIKGKIKERAMMEPEGHVEKKSVFDGPGGDVVDGRKIWYAGGSYGTELTPAVKICPIYGNEIEMKRGNKDGQQSYPHVKVDWRWPWASWEEIVEDFKSTNGKINRGRRDRVNWKEYESKVQEKLKEEEALYNSKEKIKEMKEFERSCRREERKMSYKLKKMEREVKERLKDMTGKEMKEAEKRKKKKEKRDEKKTEREEMMEMKKLFGQGEDESKEEETEDNNNKKKKWKQTWNTEESRKERKEMERRREENYCNCCECWSWKCQCKRCPFYRELDEKEDCSCIQCCHHCPTQKDLYEIRMEEREQERKDYNEGEGIEVYAEFEGFKEKKKKEEEEQKAKERKEKEEKEKMEREEEQKIERERVKRGKRQEELMIKIFRGAARQKRF